MITLRLSEELAQRIVELAEETDALFKDTFGKRGEDLSAAFDRLGSNRARVAAMNEMLAGILKHQMREQA